MKTEDKGRLAEVDRRAAIYEGQADGGTDRLTGADYFGMAALTIVVTAIFWIWAV